MTFKARITTIKDVVAALGFMFTMAVLLGSALVFLIVGAWDGTVWLFKTDCKLLISKCQSGQSLLQFLPIS